MVRAAKGFVQDVGETAASRSGGLLQLAQRGDSQAERDCHRLMVGQYQLSLPVHQTTLKIQAGPVPVLRLKDWAQFLINGNHSHILVGLVRPDWRREEAILDSFWKRFRSQFPGHPIFQEADQNKLQLCKTYPMLFHGDEGRGRKHAAYLVMNFHSILGRGIGRSHRQKPIPWLKMLPNYHGSSLTTRFLYTALPKTLYSGCNEQVFADILDFAAKDIQHMFFEGVVDEVANRGKFHMCVINVTGDWPWLVDAGSLARSFRNVQKHKTQSRPGIGVCHLCAAGRPGYDFEQINTLQPTWLETMHALSPFADDSSPSPFFHIPHIQGEVGALFQFDVFHTCHLGVCKAFLGSALALLSEAEAGTNSDVRFQTLTDKYLSWCREAKRRPWVTKLTRDLIGWPASTSFPNGTWHKGDLSTTLMLFVQVQFERYGDSWSPMLQEAGAACVSLNMFLQKLYAEDVWVTPRAARQILDHGFDFLVRYVRLARMAHQQGLLLWVLQPKLHAFHHLIFQMRPTSSNALVINIVCFGTQQDEDFISKPSRLSRRVSPKPISACERVVQRYLQAAFAQWVKQGYITQPKPGAV